MSQRDVELQSKLLSFPCESQQALITNVKTIVLWPLLTIAMSIVGRQRELWNLGLDWQESERGREERGDEKCSGRPQSDQSSFSLWYWSYWLYSSIIILIIMIILINHHSQDHQWGKQWWMPGYQKCLCRWIMCTRRKLVPLCDDSVLFYSQNVCPGFHKSQGAEAWYTHHQVKHPCLSSALFVICLVFSLFLSSAVGPSRQ